MKFVCNRDIPFGPAFQDRASRWIRCNQVRTQELVRPKGPETAEGCSRRTRGDEHFSHNTLTVAGGNLRFDSLVIEGSLQQVSHARRLALTVNENDGGCGRTEDHYKCSHRNARY